MCSPLQSRKAQLLCAVTAWTLITVAVLSTISMWTVSSSAVQNISLADVDSSISTFPTPRGFLVALRYYEQQTQAIHNLLRFQCFANSYSMKVLEPFVDKSMFTTQLSKIAEGEKFLRFRDLFDIDHWNDHTDSFGYPELASWTDFLRYAPKKLIAYCIKYRDPPLHVTIPGFNYKLGCDKNCFKNLNITVKVLATYGFKLVRSVCANFIDYAGAVTSESFMENALGKYKPNQVTILMNEFRGFFGLYRLPVLSNCGIVHHKMNISINPSKQILEDTSYYLKHYFESKPYVAIIARIERVILHLKHDITVCTENVTSALKEITSNRNLVQKFLSMDVGKFGSGGAQANNLQPTGELLFKTIYGNAWSFKEWEKSFEDFASSDSSAYVANLQRTIAAKADCLIMVGGGSFQQQAKVSYLNNHPNPSTHCIYKICH